MSEFIAPIILVGPTAVGKTNIALDIIAKTGGVLVNSDRHYLYASDDICLGIGLERDELQDGIERHLFGQLAPHQQPTEPAAYLNQAIDTIASIHASGRLAVVEGCTRRYSFELMRHFGLAHCASITWVEGDNVEERIRRRIRKLAKNDGIVEETRHALELGYDGTFPLTALMYVASKGVLRGELTRDEAEAQMIAEWGAITSRHDKVFRAIEGLSRYHHDTKQTAKTADAIIQQMLRAQPKIETLMRC